MPEPGVVGPALLIVSGPPCTGKTTLARQIAAALSLPFFYKDVFKEALFDALGSGDVAWSKRLSSACFELLYQVAHTELAAGRSLGLEGNFRPAVSAQRYRDLCTECSARPFEVYCTADPLLIATRFRERWASGQRHPGHLDASTADAVAESILRGDYAPLELGGPLVCVDTTDWASVNTAKLIQQARGWL